MKKSKTPAQKFKSKAAKGVMHRPSIAVMYNPYDASVLGVSVAPAFRSDAMMKGVVESSFARLAMDRTELDISVLSFQDVKEMVVRKVAQHNQGIIKREK